MRDENTTPPARETPPPSYFAALGSPCCSCWGKSELEWIALAYVQALAADGDTWKKLTREQVCGLLTDEQKRGGVYSMLSSDTYQHWFDDVASRIVDADGAFSVGGLGWSRWRYDKALRAARGDE